MIKDVASDPHANIATDHIPVWVKLKITYKKSHKSTKPQEKKEWMPPNDEDRDDFTTKLAEKTVENSL